jgi:exopolysaccharide biosynthesis operon protein EpsL
VKTTARRTALALAATASAAIGSNGVFAAAVVDFRDTLDRAVAAPDVPPDDQRTNRFDPYVGDDVAYDSNLYRLPASLTDLATLPGIGPNPSRNDTTNSLIAGLDAEWLLGNRQSIDLDLNGSDNRYFRNSDLDNISSTDRLAWNWGLGGALSGQVGADYARFLGGFLNTDTYSKNEIQKTEVFAAGRYQVGPRWALFGGLLDTKYDFTAAGLAANDSQTKAVEMGVDFLTNAENRIGFDYRYTDARYPNTVILNDRSFDPDYREDRARILVKYALSDKTLIDANVGYLKRDYPNSAIADFSGEIGRLVFQWQPTPKTQLVVGAWQDITSDLTAQTDYFVSKGASLSPVWIASEKINFTLTISREYHDYLGANPAAVNPLGVSTTALSQSRRDTVTGETGIFIYTPTNIITITVTAGHEVRDSNVAQFQYTDNRGDANITFKF